MTDSSSRILPFVISVSLYVIPAFPYVILAFPFVFLASPYVFPASEPGSSLNKTAESRQNQRSQSSTVV